MSSKRKLAYSTISYNTLSHNIAHEAAACLTSALENHISTKILFALVIHPGTAWQQDPD